MPDIFTSHKKKPTPHKTESKPEHLHSESQHHTRHKEEIQITTDANLPRGKINFLTNFRLYPEGLTVQNQEADEVLILFLRRDLATNIPWIIISMFLLFVPFIFAVIPEELSFTFLTPRYLIIMNLFYYLLVVGFIMLNFFNWFYNISIVTTQRIIDLDYANITYKHVGATTIDNVEDVSYGQAGFLRSFFDFGNVLVQTKGEIQNFDFNEVPKPAKVVDIVIDLVRGKKGHE